MLQSGCFFHTPPAPDWKPYSHPRYTKAFSSSPNEKMGLETQEQSVVQNLGRIINSCYFSPDHSRTDLGIYECELKNCKQERTPNTTYLQLLRVRSWIFVPKIRMAPWFEISSSIWSPANHFATPPTRHCFQEDTFRVDHVTGNTYRKTTWFPVNFHAKIWWEVILLWAASFR